MNKIRTRYAPSPTGFLHIGGARTALFCYLFAKHFNGDFIIRMEDTDISRNVEGGEKSQIENLAWLGIIADEDPYRPNKKYGKYRQSEKLERYNELIQKLINDGLAYKAYDTKEEIDLQKQEQEKNGISSFRFDKNWLKISKEEIEKRDKNNEYSVRIQLKKNTNYKWRDLVRGLIEVNSDEIGDFVILKSDGYPTYNFAVVVDDFDMKISHILRGEEHITNTPKQLILYEALGWKPPQFGHLTIITNMEGKKLSKRDLNLNQFIEDYKKDGYIAEAIFNFLALLGWTSEDKKEILNKEELIKKFDYNRLSKSPSKFDIKKMEWFSKNYMKNLDNFTIEQKIIFSKNQDKEWRKIFIDTYKESSINFKEMQNELYFYEQEVMNLEIINNEVTKKFKAIFDINNFTIDNINNTIKKTAEDLQIKGKDLFLPIRISLTGKEHGPELAKCIFLVGKKKIEQRLELIK
ncbi:MAG: glutamate--tRNA ligase [Metamycoplasmataceae bacterium]